MQMGLSSACMARSHCMARGSRGSLSRPAGRGIGTPLGQRNGLETVVAHDVLFWVESGGQTGQQSSPEPRAHRRFKGEPRAHTCVKRNVNQLGRPVCLRFLPFEIVFFLRGLH